MKRRRYFILSAILSQDLTHVGLNVHAQKKGCIRNGLKFAMTLYSFAALF